MSDIVQDWIDGYRKAWTTNDAADVRALFTEDAVYRHSPFDPDPWLGAEEIVAGWTEHPDDPSDWTFEGHPVVYADGVGVIQGETRYSDGSVYANLWVIRFADDGRASEFTEWWMKPKAE